MSIAALVVIAAHAPLAYWLWRDSFVVVNAWADALEDRFFPPWFQWTHSGDRVSWLHHGLTAMGFAAYGAVWGWILPDSAWTGALVGSVAATLGYAVRETISWRESARKNRTNKWSHPNPKRTGWAVDGIMDVVVPALVALICWIGA